MSLFSSPSRNSRRGPGERETLSILAADVRVEGTLSTAGVIRIEGIVIGKVQAERLVVVAKGGIVEGDIHAWEAVLSGKVIGSVLCNGRVELQPSAVLEGNITTPRLVVHEGAVVRSRIRMGTQNRAPSSHLEPRTVVGRSHATADVAQGVSSSRIIGKSSGPDRRLGPVMTHGAISVKNAP